MVLDRAETLRQWHQAPESSRGLPKDPLAPAGGSWATSDLFPRAGRWSRGPETAPEGPASAQGPFLHAALYKRQGAESESARQHGPGAAALRSSTMMVRCCACSRCVPTDISAKRFQAHNMADTSWQRLARRQHSQDTRLFPALADVFGRLCALARRLRVVTARHEWRPRRMALVFRGSAASRRADVLGERARPRGAGPVLGALRLVEGPLHQERPPPMEWALPGCGAQVSVGLVWQGAHGLQVNVSTICTCSVISTTLCFCFGDFQKCMISGVGAFFGIGVFVGIPRYSSSS